jgi:glycosyltransferase involved in cell wall biosynthesis
MLDSWTARLLGTHFHAITHAVKDASIRALGIDPRKVTVIERGRNPERLGQRSPERRARIRRSLGLGEEDEVLVNVGRQEFQKGQAGLLTAFARIAAVRPRARLLIVGRAGNASAKLAQLQGSLGLGQRLQFLGYRADVPDILAGADMFVFPSMYEGQGGALIEAMALGLPVVATDIPSTREVVDRDGNACLVPQEPESLAEAILRLLDDRDRMETYGRRSVEIFHARFTLDKSAARMIELYRGLIGGSPIRYVK